MKNLLRLGAILLMTLCTAISTKAQSSDIENEEDLKLPPLQLVIDSVLSRNGMLKFRKTNIQVKETTLASERINWTKSFGIQGDTRYGNLNNFSTNGDGLVSSSILTETKQFNYNIGVYLKISVFDVLNRKHQVGLARLEVDEAKSMAQFQEDEIRQNVIRLYQEIILKQRVLKIKSKNLGDGKVNMQMVEKEFRNGIVPVAEYVRITSITTNLEVDYEMARSEFIIAKNILEDMAGFLFFN